jgi:glycosyltransferase involved in cell wall biosynthesis
MVATLRPLVGKTTMFALRIVLATAFPADPQAPRGGVEAVSVTLASGLARQSGLELHIVATDPNCLAPVRSSWLGVQVHRLPWTAPRMLSGVIGADAARLRRYINSLNPDLVHAHDTYGIMQRALPVPRVLTIHGFIHADTRVSGERLARIRSLFWRRLEISTWARFPHIISISPYVRERLAGIATGSVHNIDNPIDANFFDVERRDRGLRVFCAAAVSPRKNTLALVNGFARATAGDSSATLTIAGPQPLPSYTEAVRRRIHRLQLTDRVAVLAALSTSEVRQELACASVAALVSVEENAPLAVQEAMAAGVPVVASNRCGMPYQVSDGETGFLVNPLNEHDIAARLSALLADAGLRQQFGARARVIARERFHPDQVSRRTVEVYGRAAAN